MPGRRIHLGKPLPKRPTLSDVRRMLRRCVEDVEWKVTPRGIDGVTTPCWMWQGGCDPSGYGFIKVGGRKHWVHRVSHEACKGPLAAGMDADHLCFNRGCINPEHLVERTRAVNERRHPPRAIVEARKKRRRRRQRRELVPAGGDEHAPF